MPCKGLHNSLEGQQPLLNGVIRYWGVSIYTPGSFFWMDLERMAFKRMEDDQIRWKQQLVYTAKRSLLGQIRDLNNASEQMESHTEDQRQTDAARKTSRMSAIVPHTIVNSNTTERPMCPQPFKRAMPLRCEYEDKRRRPRLAW